nr:MAG TPA: hypothetical protein [Caudoviricetes sp.]
MRICNIPLCELVTYRIIKPIDFLHYKPKCSMNNLCSICCSHMPS